MVAAEEYRQMLAEGVPDAAWRPLVMERLDAMRARLGGDPAAAKSAPPASSSAPAASPSRGPSAEDFAAADRLSAADRDRMIEDMVAGLASRLEKDGRDLAGWQRLIRAYTVMGRKAEAMAALGRARRLFTDEPHSLAALTALATSLGLGS